MKDLAALLSQHCMHTVKQFLWVFFYITKLAQYFPPPPELHST